MCAVTDVDPLQLRNLKTIRMCPTHSSETVSNRVHEHPISCSRVTKCGQADGQTY
jgi:hypothetical protein